MFKSIFVIHVVFALLTVNAKSPSWVGMFNGYLNALPHPQLPHVPMLGNGHSGILFDARNDSSSFPSVGPGRYNTLDMWINSNTNWGCQACADPVFNVTPSCCQVVGFGGMSISMTPSYGSKETALYVRMQQRIGQGTIYTSWSTPHDGTVETLSFIDPVQGHMITNVTWRAGAGDPPVITVEISAWILDKTSLATPKSYGKSSNQTMYVSRGVTNIGLARKSPWISLTLSGVGKAVSAPRISATSVAQNYSLSPETPLTIVTVLHETFDGVTDPTIKGNSETAGIVASRGWKGIFQSSKSWWKQFWSKSFVSFPTQPLIEQMWYGAQYTMAISSSTDKNIPGPGLYGPFVTSDNPGWHGDYTLDYNYETPYFGVFSSNHAEVAESYWAPIVDWVAPGQRMAQIEAKIAGVQCPANALHYACHLAPWGSQSIDQTIYMHWNGAFALLPFLNHWEYTQNISFALNVTYPLIEGMTAWWGCYLAKDPKTLLYNDYNLFNPDAQHEGQLVPNPQIGLSLIRRMFQVQIDIDQAAGRTPPQNIVNMLQNLVSFNVGTDSNNNPVWTAYTNASVADSDWFANYPVWPSEAVRGEGSSKSFEITQYSSKIYTDFANGRSVDLFPQVVLATLNGPNINTGYTPNEIVNGLNQYLANYFGPNLLPYAPGGGIENVAITRAVNDMLLSTVGNAVNAPLRLFGAWPSNETAAFENLVAKGGFAVSAYYDSSKGSVVPPVFVEPLSVRLNVQIMNPWKSCANVSASCDSVSVPITISPNGVISFNAPRQRSLCKVVSNC
eukprot:PhF_6_TR37160/c0_g1_i1/m.54704